LVVTLPTGQFVTDGGHAVMVSTRVVHTVDVVYSVVLIVLLVVGRNVTPVDEADFVVPALVLVLEKCEKLEDNEI